VGTGSPQKMRPLKENRGESDSTGAEFALETGAARPHPVRIALLTASYMCCDLDYTA